MTVCVRCGVETGLPEDYPMALSRADNETKICPTCGVEEGLIAFVIGRTEGRAPTAEEYARVLNMRDWPMNEEPV